MLELKHLCFEAETDEGVRQILKDVSLTVDERMVVITGPNGSGKSTMAKLIAGIEQPTSGQILLDGEDITHMSITERARRGISFAFQQPVRFKGITVFDLISIASGKKLSTNEACTYLSEVGLCARDYVNREVNDSLSGGELKRIEIATMLARGTKMSIFDEPEAGIDLWSFQNLISVFEKMHETIHGSILHGIPEGAYNIRADGKLAGRNTTAHINIVTKEDKPGIDIYIAPGTKNESVHIPVIISQTGLKDMVYNDFFIGEDCDVTIVAGCGIHNCGTQGSRHDGIHSFFVGKNARVRYIEKHYGEGDGNGENVMNPTTIVDLGENAYMEMETTQIKGIDSTIRDTKAHLTDGATLIIKEKIMTHGHQHAETNFSVDLDGYESSTNVISRSVAKDHSTQMFNSNIRGNNKCAGHSECDAIIMDNGVVGARPEITANSVDASLIHEAAIGKIAGEQLNKLMTLGLTEKEAEEQIISGFLK